MLELALLTLGFVAASGFFAMIDAALLNVTPAEVEVLVTQKYWGARELRRLLRHTTRVIIVVVVLTNVTNILGPILIGKKTVELFGSDAIGVITAILTFATIIFSEVIPKSLGAHYAPTISRFSAPILYAIVLILHPVVIVLEKAVRLLKKGKRQVGTEEQIRALANIGGGAGHIDTDERELIHRAFVLNDRRTRDIMTPASAIVSIPATATVREAAQVIFEHHYSRYPVADPGLDGVSRYLLSRDVLQTLAEGQNDASAIKLSRMILRIDGNLRGDELLNMLRNTHSQIAIVAEGKKIIGLVTMEDVLEELVGEIEDEGDV